MIIKPLPSWALINRFSSFYEGESLTAVEQTARVYAKMQELIESYNKYIEQVNTELMELEKSTDKDLNCAIKTLINLTDSYISTVDLKLIRMSRTLDENYVAFTDNVLQTISNMVQELKENGELDAALLDAVDDLGNRFTEVQAQWDSTLAELSADYEATKTELSADYEGTKSDLQEHINGVMAEWNSNLDTMMSEVDAKYERAEFELADSIHHLEGELQDSVEELKTDYVVECGAIDGWYYRKWNSGIFDAHTSKLLGVLDVAANEYASNSFQLPFLAYGQPCITVTPFIATDTKVSVCIPDNNGTRFTVRVNNLGGETLPNVSLQIQVMGRWKAFEGSVVTDE